MPFMHYDEPDDKDGPKARAWHRYYESLRDDPESTPDQRKRAIRLIKQFPLPIEHQRPEDLA